MSLQMIWQNAREAIETLYEDTCTITAYMPETDEDGITSTAESVICEEEPCRVSFTSLQNTSDTMAPEQSQEVTLFLSPDLTVPPGCRIDVTRYGAVFTYKSSGIPAVYPTHQEIRLESYEETP